MCIILQVAPKHQFIHWVFSKCRKAVLSYSLNPNVLLQGKSGLCRHVKGKRLNAHRAAKWALTDCYLVTVFSFLLSQWLKPGDRFSFGDRFGLQVTATGASMISRLAVGRKGSFGHLWILEAALKGFRVDLHTLPFAIKLAEDFAMTLLVHGKVQ